MKHLTIRLAVLLLSTLGFLTGAYGQITPSGDAYTNTAAPAANYGAKPLLDVESALQTTYIRFDLSSLPSGYTSANITKATLKLYINAVTTAGSFNVDLVNGTWAEGTITANNVPALGSTIAASVPLTTANKNDYIIIDITSAVGAWLNGTDANDGIALVGNSPLNASFDSKENTSMSHPPELDIVFAGGGGGITGVDTASGSGLTGGGTSGTLNLSLINTCASGQMLQWNGNSWICASTGTGTITGVTAGTDLTGGGTGGNVTLNLDTTRIPQLGAGNTFAGNQTVNGNVTASGTVTGGLVNTSTSYDIAGTQVVSILPGLFNLYVGQAAGQGAGANNTGSNNTSAGYQTLFLNTSGGGNAAFGTMALYSNTTGVQNTATGADALTGNTTGSDNTATGDFALQLNTTGFGNTAGSWGALAASTTGSGNTAEGYSALRYNTTGLNNTGLGTYAGNPTSSAATTGSSNTYVGYQANPGTQLNLSNATAIGANAQVTTSNALVLGSINGVNGATADAFVGIGTTAPAYKLHVGTINNGLRVEGPPTPGGVAASFGGNGDFAIDGPGIVGGRFIVKDSTGFIGIGTQSPANTLEVGAGGTTLADTWTTRSSRRWKTNIHTLDGALAKVEQLRGVSYDLRESGKHEVGVIAEEVGAVVPEVVSWEMNGKDAQGVDYSRLTALLIEATKEQQALIRQQQKQIQAQQAQIAHLTAQVTAIQTSLKTSGRGNLAMRNVKAQVQTVRQ